MNILNLPTCQASYIPCFVNETAVSPAYTNPKNWTAEDLVDRMMGRKAFARIPIELFMAINEASNYGEHNMAERLRQSLHNVQGSILLDLKNEAEEGSLAMAWIKNRLLEFPDAVPGYVPFIPPLRHPDAMREVTFGEPAPTSSQKDMPSETINQQDLTQQAKTALMTSLIKSFDIYQSFNETLINLGAQKQSPQAVANAYEEFAGVV